VLKIFEKQKRKTEKRRRNLPKGQALEHSFPCVSHWTDREEGRIYRPGSLRKEWKGESGRKHDFTVDF
jgi:hypothetical protein